jgi:hypothetical protein
MVRHLATTIEEEQYYCKALSNETIKTNVTTSESYWKFNRQLQQEKIVHHTNQIKEYRAYRAVIRNLHHSALGTSDSHTDKQSPCFHHSRTEKHTPWSTDAALESESDSLRLTDIQAVCLGGEPSLGLMTRYLF